MTEGQEITIPQPESFTKEEAGRAIRGAQEFKTILIKCGSDSRKVLLNSEAGEKLQCMFLGIKPVSGLLSHEAEKVKVIPLPGRFRFVGDHIYDTEAVDAVIKQNPDVFPDFSGDIDQYMKKFLGNGDPAASNHSDTILKIGVLYGFPKIAAIEYARYYQDYWHNLVDFSVWAAYSVFYTPDRWGEIARETVLHYGARRKDGKLNGDPNYLNDFLDQRENEVEDYLSRANPSWPKDAIDYCVKIRGRKIKAFQFLIRRDLPEKEGFKKKVEGLYETSGMNKVLTDSKKVPVWQRWFRRG